MRNKTVFVGELNGKTYTDEAVYIRALNEAIKSGKNINARVEAKEVVYNDSCKENCKELEEPLLTDRDINNCIDELLKLDLDNRQNAIDTLTSKIKELDFSHLNEDSLSNAIDVLSSVYDRFTSNENKEINELTAEIEKLEKEYYKKQDELISLSDEITRKKCKVDKLCCGHPDYFWPKLLLSELLDIFKELDGDLDEDYDDLDEEIAECDGDCDKCGWC